MVMSVKLLRGYVRRVNVFEDAPLSEPKASNLKTPVP
jgi:hypothetical protein